MRCGSGVPDQSRLSAQAEGAKREDAQGVGARLEEDEAGIPPWFREDNAKGTGAPAGDWRSLTLRLGESYPSEPPIADFAERAAGSSTAEAEVARAAFHAAVGDMEGPRTVTRLGQAWQQVLATAAPRQLSA